MVVDKNISILEGETFNGKFETWSKRTETVVNSCRNGKRIADQTAVICGEKIYTFDEINRLANRLARSLVKEIRMRTPGLPSSREHFICTFGGTSDVHIIEWLAMNKMGIGIMSLTPSATGEKIKSLLEGSNPLCLLVDRNFEKELKEKNLGVFLNDTAVVYFQDIMKQNVDVKDENLEDCERFQVPEPDGVFFITTTSGTTGAPKFVPVTHKALVCLLASQIARLNISDGSVFLTHNIITNTNLDTILPLVTGYPQVVLTGEQNKNPETVAEAIDKHKVTCISFISPSLLGNVLLYLQCQSDPHSCKSLRWVECSAETLPFKVAKSFFDYFPAGVGLYNGWSMVETGDQTVISQFFESEEDLNEGSYGGQVSIGLPTYNTNVYILDDDLKPVKKGERGHLCLSGTCIFKGYPGISKSETLVKNPFTQKQDHSNLFITGDFARIFNGRIIFEGRHVHHVKIRGFRLHTGEVEACIAKHLPEIKNVCVRGIDSKGSQTELVCFYVTGPGESVKENDIITVCKEHLEEYKVPMAVHKIDKIPVQPPNDKVNNKRLAEMHLEWKKRNVPEDDIPQRDLDPITDVLFTIISDSFDIPKYSLNEESKISDIGGTSVNIVWVWSKLKQKGFDFKMMDILGSKKLSDILSKMQNGSGNYITNKESNVDELYDTVDLFQQADAMDCLPLVAHNFAERNDAFKLAGADYDKCMEVLRIFWDVFKKSNFSSAIRDKKTGKYLAVNLNSIGRYDEEIDYDALVETVPCTKPLVAIMQTVEEPMKILLRQLPPETLNSWYVGVDPDLGPDETLMVIRMLDDYDLRRAKEAGFKRICGTAMHPVTKATWEDNGYVTVHVVATRDIHAEGVKYFEDLSEDHIMAAQFMSLYDPKEHDIVIEALREGKTTLK